jgi:competence protein ComEA
MMGSLAIAAGMSFAAMPAHALDVNSATAEQLTGIRGVGPKTADVIIKERERGGRFESLEDLSDRVRGIGPKKAQALQAAGLRVESAAGAPAAPRVGTTPAQDAKGRPDARGGTARPGARLGGRANP